MADGCRKKDSKSVVINWSFQSFQDDSRTFEAVKYL